MATTDCITLDYLELFCERHRLVIGCASEEEEIWISPLGPHPASLTSERVHQILRESPRFEIRTAQEEEPGSMASIFLSRAELEQRLRLMLN